MNIVHIITTIDRGGAENQLIQNLLTQSRKGINVSVLFLKGDSYWKNYLLKKGIKVYGPFFNKFYYYNIKGLFSFYKIINKREKILHCHMPPSLLLAGLLGIFSSNKIIYTSHNDEPFIPINILDFFFSKIIFRRANQIIAITSTVKTFLVNRYKLNPRIICVIDYSFDNQIYFKNGSSNEFDFYKKDTVYIGTVARLVKQKRIDLLIKAFKEVNKSNKNIILVVLGDGERKKELLELSNNLGLRNKIIWIKYSEFVTSHMKNWSLFCLTSEYEGFGLVLLEAIYSNIPVVAMNVSSIKDIIGPCGEVVKFGNYFEFAEKIKHVLKNKNDYLKNNHLIKFSPEINFRKHLEVYNFFCLQK